MVLYMGMTTIKTKAGEILVFKLPSDAEQITASFDKRHNRTFVTYSVEVDVIEKWKRFRVDGELKFIGTTSHDLKFSFDPEPFVEKMDEIHPVYYKVYGEDWHIQTMSKETSFISLIESTNQILWSNPMGEEPSVDKPNGNLAGVNQRIKLIAWQEYEDLVITKDEIAVVLYNPNR
jgi:hypothetical protein